MWGTATAVRERRNATPKVRRQRVLFVCSDEIIHAQRFVVIQGQLADDGAEGDLWRFHIHFIKNFLDLYYHLAITQNNDGVGALVGNDLGIANRHRFWRG